MDKEVEGKKRREKKKSENKKQIMKKQGELSICLEDEKEQNNEQDKQRTYNVTLRGYFRNVSISSAILTA